jgi:hypothetical protein
METFPKGNRSQKSLLFKKLQLEKVKIRSMHALLRKNLPEDVPQNSWLEQRKTSVPL